ncbi:MAG: hypothetical protein IPL61_09915 [Myxococcales bacterium]|nr:hypothetical protein [Myxococcales bacterium]
MKAMSITVSGDATRRRLALRGRLDELTTLVEHVPTWAAREVVVDSGELGFINSIGIREWMHFLDALARAGAAIVHERCSEPLVEQMCFIPAVRGGGAVRSFFAPYLCPHCAHEASILIEVEAHRATLSALQAPPATCPSCDEPMTLADLPERWFAFLKS